MSKNLNRVKKSLISVFLTLLLVFPLMSGMLATGAISAYGYNISGSGTKYTVDYADKTELHRESDNLNVEIAGEGQSLLYNNGLLPLNAATDKISIFGQRSYNFILGGGGSGSGNIRYGEDQRAVYMVEALARAGFALNEDLVKVKNPNYTTNNFSLDSLSMGTSGNNLGIFTGNTTEMDLTDESANAARINVATAALKATYPKAKPDAKHFAVMTLSFMGQEFNDAAMFNIAGKPSSLDHYYTLSTAERTLIDFIGDQFGNNRLIIVVNSGNPIEMGWLADHPAVGAIIWMGTPGKTGALATGKIISGEINPSGRTVDIFPAQFRYDPTWANFGFNGGGHTRLDPANLSEGVLQTQELDGTWGANHLIGGNTGFTQVQNRFTYSRLENGMPFKIDGPINDAGFAAVLQYKEGIYMGSQYYETAAELGFFEDKFNAEFTATNAGGKNVTPAWTGTHPWKTDANKTFADFVPGGAAGDPYYNRWNGVIFPLGHGLSYTTFDWKTDSTDKYITDKNGDITIEVSVKNTGTRAGKDVIQVYTNPPYYTGGIEKAAARLITFAKTKLLEPGESQTLTIKFPVMDLMSFDHDDINGNGFAGWELEAGDYFVSLRTNSHEVKPGCDVKYTVGNGPAVSAFFTNAATAGANGFAINIDPHTGAQISPLFTGDGVWDGTRSDNDYYESRRTAFNSVQPWTEFTRADFIGTFPKSPTLNELKFTKNAQDILADGFYKTTFNDLPTDPWYKSKTDIPANWTQAPNSNNVDHATAPGNRVNGRTRIQLAEMAGVDYDDPLWDVFMNQMTYEEMRGAITSNSFNTPVQTAIGKPVSSDQDGPNQLQGGAFFTGEPIIAGTYNVELAERNGRMVGNTGLMHGTHGWYGPGLNIHRNPAAGRNFEYYSQDGKQGAIIAAAVIKGATDKGMVVYAKHLFLNDQESNRNNATTWITEQAIREIYGKMAELPMKFGGLNAQMTAFNRLGLASMSNYNVQVRLYEKEWGFKAFGITDMYGNVNYCPGQPGELNVRTGIGPLGNYNSSVAGRNVALGTWDPVKKTVVHTFGDAYHKIQGAASATGIWSTKEWTAEEMLSFSKGEYVATGWGLTGTGNITPGDTNDAARAVSLHSELNGFEPLNNKIYVAYKNATKLSDVQDFRTNGLGRKYVTGDKIDSYTQWYAIRTSAKKQFYAQANSMTMRNGITDNPLNVGHTGTGTTSDRILLGSYQNSERVNYSLIATAALNDIRTNISGRKVEFFLSSGTLPDGLTLNRNTGIISGTLANTNTVGNKDFAVRVVIDGWIGGGGAGTGNNETRTQPGNYVTNYRLVVADATPLWLTGTTDPVAGQGALGDIYLNSASGNMFIKKAEGWTDVGTIAGLTATQVQAIVNAAVAGHLNTTQVQAIVDAAVANRLTSAQVQTIVDAAVANRLTSAQVQTIVDAAVSGRLKEAEVQALIDAALKAHVEEGGCGSAIDSGNFIGIFSVGLILLAGAFMFIVKRKKKQN